MSDARLLAGVRVVEWTDAEPRSGTCARLLESLGADIWRLSAAGLQRAREPLPSLDLIGAPQRQQLLAALESADVLVETRGAQALHELGLGPDQLRAHHSRLVHVSITPFGSYGPRAHYRGGELVCSALGGVLRVVGDRDRVPVKEALDACLFHAQSAAAAAIAIALCEREQSGAGQHIDVSVQEVAASRLTNAIVLWQFDRRKLERCGSQLRYGRAAVRCLWPLRDGYAFHTLMSGRFGAAANAALSSWLDELGYENPLRNVDWIAYDRSALPAETRARWESSIGRFFSERTKAEISGEGRQRGINATVLHEPADVLADPQLAARDFWHTERRAGREIQRPGAFMQVQAGPEPEQGFTGRREGGKWSVCSAHVRGAHLRLPAFPPSCDPILGGGALAGVKVLDLSWALVGSLTTKALADHGACVVKVESARRPCLTRVDAQVARSRADHLDDKPWFAQLNTSKLSLQLDLKHPRAREVLDPLISWADVIVENFSPGTLDTLGLDYATLVRRHPTLIMVSGSAYGQTGPLAQSWGVDGTSAALSARTWLSGWPDRAPVLPAAVPYADAVVPQFMVTAIAAAVRQRRRTGRGAYIDVSMYEISVQQMTRALLDAQLGRPPQRSGNRDAGVWHQGVYPASGDDRFIAISLFDRDDYAKLIEIAPGAWPEVAAVESGDDEVLARVDAGLAAYTCQHEEFALMCSLQAAGIAAGVVQDVEDVLQRDPQLRCRPAFARIDHSLLGPFEHQTTPYHLARTPGRMSRAPSLGEHTGHVCLEILGLDPALYEALSDAGLFR
jgi:crotonobetainyl-CoA:carnitine CoA-transferase CaiB-like acyl-CoA transferase